MAETDRRVPEPSCFFWPRNYGKGGRGRLRSPEILYGHRGCPQVKPDVVETEAPGPSSPRRRVKLEISELLVRIIGKLSDILEKDLTSSCL